MLQVDRCWQVSNWIFGCGHHRYSCNLVSCGGESLVLHLAFSVTVNCHAKLDPSSFLTLHAELIGNMQMSDASQLQVSTDKLSSAAFRGDWKGTKVTKFPHKD